MLTTAAKPSRRRSLTRLAIFVFALAAGANLYYSASSKTASISLPKTAESGAKTLETGRRGTAALTPASMMFATLLQGGSETIATYAPDCTTPKIDFALGDQVCAKATGFDANLGRSVTLTNAGGIVIQRIDLGMGDTATFTLPTNQSDVFFDNVSVDNRGTWRVNLVPTGGYDAQAAASFSVSDPTAPAANLGVYNAVIAPLTDVQAGDNITVLLQVRNDGPAGVPATVVTEQVPSNATFFSATQVSGPTFTCTHPAQGGTGSSDCTITNFASGDQAVFEFVYTVSSGAPIGTIIASLANIGQVTDPAPTTIITDLNASDNQWTARTKVSANPNAPVCSLGCPSNLTISANATNGNNESGAVVNFSGDIESSGDCGAITATPQSGTFFTVNGSPHMVSVSSANGGSCSFTITVTETAPPEITCAADQTEQAPSGSNEASVQVTPPTVSGGNNVQVTGSRSDGRGVDDPYPVGTTIITWLAEECNNAPVCDDPAERADSCTQKIIVTATDAPTISCASNKTFSADSCTGKTLSANDIGSPTATGNNVTVTGQRSDNLDLYNDPYPVGTTAITWTATDDGGRQASCTQTITINSTGVDNTPPTITAPPNVSVTTTNCGIIVGESELGTPTVSDDCGTPNVSRIGVPPGNFFPTGTTTITYTATDGAGNTATATQTVTVTEDPAIPPTVTAPNDLTVYTGAGATECSVHVGDATLGNASVSDNCPGATVSRTGVPSGNGFPVGTTTITYTATDRSGNTASDTQTVTVIDNTVPVVTPPANVTAYTGPGATECGTVVNDATIGTASATDNCPGVGAINRTGVPSGNNFPLGTTTITYSVTDANGNSSSATQTVTVIDNTVPVITTPANVTAYTGPGAASCGTVVGDATIGTASATDNCPGVGAISRTGVPAGNVFPVGTTTINYSVTDAHGNTGTATQTVTVIDNTAPVISCPAPIVLEPTCPSGAIANWTPPVGTDNCPAAVTSQTAGGSPGSVFPIGTTTVSYTVTDTAGNSASCSFTVTVKTVLQTIDDLRASVAGNQQLTGPQRNGLLSKLDATKQHIQNGNQNGACSKLADFVNSVQNFISHGDVSAATGNAWISTANNVRNTIGCTNNPCS
jgi:hypothetical protein